jgi:site-specific DNA recombinase
LVILNSKANLENEASIKYSAIYARTSSPNQKYNHSIQEQVDQCWKFCDDRGWETKYVFVDECESGGTTDRPKFQLMLEGAESDNFDVIICWKLDRFCRSLVDLINIESELKKWDVNLCSVTEYIDTTTPVGRFNFRSLASVAEFERELIGQRSRMGLHALAKKHGWPNPHPPLGYDIGDQGKLVKNPVECNVVRFIFDLYLERRSMPQVAYELNQQGIPTKKVNNWNTRAVRDVITNELYVGHYSVAGFDDHVEDFRIIDDDVFKRAKIVRDGFHEQGSTRKRMPRDRKISHADKIFRNYLGFLDNLGALIQND